MPVHYVGEARAGGGYFQVLGASKIFEDVG